MKRIITLNRHFENGCEKCIKCSILRWPLKGAFSSLTFQQPIFTFREYDMRYAIKHIHNLTTVICTLRNVISLFYICTFYCYLTLYTICTDEQCFMPHKCWHFDFYQIKLQLMIRTILPRIIFKLKILRWYTIKNRFILH